MDHKSLSNTHIKNDGIESELIQGKKFQGESTSSPKKPHVSMKKIVVRQDSKPDIKLKSELQKGDPPISMLNMTFQHPLTQSFPNLKIQDEDMEYKSNRHFDLEMIINDNPESLDPKVNAIKSIKSLRQFKLGTSPTEKVRLINESLFGDTPNDPKKSPSRQSNLSAKSRAAMKLQNDLDITINNQLKNIHFNNTNNTIKEKKNDEKPPLVRKPSHLQSQNGKTEDVKLPFVMSSSGSFMNDESNNDSDSDFRPKTPLYTPGSFRRPKTRENPEDDDGAGSTLGTEIEEVLSRAEQSGDSFLPDRREVFLMDSMKSLPLDDASIESSDSLKDRSKIPVMRLIRKNARDADQLGYHRPLSRNNTNPMMDELEIEKEKERIQTEVNKPHCNSCFKDAVLWCTQCNLAYCVTCWNRVPHHTLYNLAPREAVTAALAQTPKLRKRPSQSEFADNTGFSSPKSYSTNILFATYPSENNNNNTYGSGKLFPNGAVDGNSAPAPIPRDESLFDKFQDYPHPPVFLDGTGKVIHYQPIERPISMPRYAVSTHPHPMIPRSPPNRPHSHSSEPFEQNISSQLHYVSKEQYAAEMNGIEYKKKMKMPRVMSGKLVVRKEKYRGRNKAPKSAFSLGASAVTIEQSCRPSTTMVPMEGITKEFIPVDWKTGFHLLSESNHNNNNNNNQVLPADENILQNKYLEKILLTKPREIKIFSGIPVYTVNKTNDK